MSWRITASHPGRCRPRCGRLPVKSNAPLPFPMSSSMICPRKGGNPMKMLRAVLAEAPLAWLLFAVPVAAVTHHLRPGSALLVFVLTCVSIIPLAGLLRPATEKLAARTGEAIGGFLNATLGNAAELIIALVALRAGMLDVVKASLTGSIIGNLLLVLGAAFLAGGLRHKIQTFGTVGVRLQVGMMALAAIAILVPSIFVMSSVGELASRSVAFSVV